MVFSEKINTINNKIKPSKAQYDLNRQTVLALSSGNVGKYKFFTGKKVLPGRTC